MRLTILLCLLLLACSDSGDPVEGEQTDFCDEANWCADFEVKKACKVTSWYQADCDDPVKHDCTISYFDSDGHKILTQNDNDCDGEALEGPSAEYHKYDNGRLTAIYKDKDGDCMPEHIERKVYDAAGHMVEEFTDLNCDGQADETCLFYEYDTSGQVSRSWGSACDGRIGGCMYYRYDEHGNLVYEEYDAGCEGDAPPPEDVIMTMDYTLCYIFEYEEDSLVHTADDENCDGLGESKCAYFEYDQAGNNTKYTGDKRCDGTEVVKSFMTYDDEGRILTWQADTDMDGEVDDCKTYSYEDSGKVRIEGVDYQCDGTGSAISRTVFDDQGRVVESYGGGGCGRWIYDCE